MIVQIEVDENGVLHVNDPNWRGKSFDFSVPEIPYHHKETNWKALKELFKQADALDIPRRTPEEIMRDLHELRESE